MVGRVLVTTADERTWPKDKPIIFLGEWCKRYRRKEAWENLDYVVARPFLATQKECDEIYPYIKDLVEKLLPLVANALNAVHKTNFSNRFWRIVLGHWLFRYTSLMYNRWGTLHQALKENDISEIGSLDYSNYQVAVKNSLTYAWASNDDVWNGAIDRMVLNALKSHSKITELDTCHDPSFVFESTIASNKKNIKSYFWLFARLFQRPNDVVLVDTYLTKWHEVLLQLLLKQFPQSYPKFELNEKTQISVAMRSHISSSMKGQTTDDCLSWIISSLNKFIPQSFVEDFLKISEFKENKVLPNNPKLIFTSNRFDTDDLFKIWSAIKIETGSRYITGQHGNNIGTRKHYFTEDECVEISDKFLTWGWQDGSPKHVPTFNFKTSGVKSPRLNKSGGLLLIDLSVENRIWPWDTDAEIGVHQNDQFRFMDSLTPDIRKDVTVRLWPNQKYLPWADQERWQDWDPSVRLSAGGESLRSLIESSRLVVHSYDSTGILEFLSWNLPCLAFWTRGLDHVRASARPYYDLLVDVGIVHLTAESCSQHVERIWNDIDSWWHSTEVQNARTIFCDRYARVSDTPLRDIRATLKAQ